MRKLSLILVILLSCDSEAQRNNIYKESAWEERDKWQSAAEFIEMLDVKEGSKVADIGCHEGYMTVKLAKAVNPDGTVYAVDVNNYRLEKLVKNLKERNIANVKVIHGDENDPKLPGNALDAVLIMDTYHEMEAHEEILKHIMQALKLGGRLVIAEAISDDRRDLSRKDQQNKHEIHIKFVRSDLKKAGYEILIDRDPFIDRTEHKGDKMWLLVARKSPSKLK